MVLNGAYGPKGKANKNQVECAFDSFLTIYFVTLPEKFKQWYNYHNGGIWDNYAQAAKMNLRGIPIFPMLENKSDHSKLFLNPVTEDYDYLPGTWDLLECFEYSLNQTETWTTSSILAECERTISRANNA